MHIDDRDYGPRNQLMAMARLCLWLPARFGLDIGLGGQADLHRLRLSGPGPNLSFAAMVSAYA